MLRTKIIVANWKMNLGVKASAKLAVDLKKSLKTKSEVVLCPEFVSIPAVSAVLKKTKIKLGAQNVAGFNSGAYTGEVSANSLKELGVKYVIIGHSERRQFQGETDEIVNQKLKLVLQIKSLIPIICVGEKAGEDGPTILKQQLSATFKGVKLESKQKVLIAYEPVFAIGTGKALNPESAFGAREFISVLMVKLYGYKTWLNNFVTLYGGSVNKDNASVYSRVAKFDGLLVGGASLNAKGFKDLIKAFTN